MIESCLWVFRCSLIPFSDFIFLESFKIQFWGKMTKTLGLHGLFLRYAQDPDRDVKQELEYVSMKFRVQAMA